MSIPGVVGTGIAATPDGRPVIEVYVERQSTQLSQALPTQIEGIPLRIVETGRFEPQ